MLCRRHTGAIDPMYAVDAMCRRSPALQSTVHAKGADEVRLNPADAASLGLKDGDHAQVSQGGEALTLSVKLSSALPPGAVAVAAATAEAEVLGAAMGPITVQANEGAAG